MEFGGHSSGGVFVCVCCVGKVPCLSKCNSRLLTRSDTRVEVKQLVQGKGSAKVGPCLGMCPEGGGDRAVLRKLTEATMFFFAFNFPFGDMNLFGGVP